ncbi:MAG: GntR family transcriptional regulator [Herbinix sp.]|nr:GntR family transcriptional regulator [Herbinix sp.]
MLDYGKEAIPLYLQIKNYIKDKIVKKEYSYQDILPSELELEKQFNVSRITVRQAILELQREGYVTRARGKGTIVIFQDKIVENLTRIRSFTEEMLERNMVPGTKDASIEMVSADELLAGIFHCNIMDPVYCVRRSRTANGIVIVYFVSYFSGKRQLPMNSDEYMGSIYELLQKNGIGKPSQVDEKFFAAKADKEIAAELEIAKGDPVLQRNRISYDRNGEVIEYTLSYYRSDRYYYSFSIHN